MYILCQKSFYKAKKMSIIFIHQSRNEWNGYTLLYYPISIIAMQSYMIYRKNLYSIYLTNICIIETFCLSFGSECDICSSVIFLEKFCLEVVLVKSGRDNVWSCHSSLIWVTSPSYHYGNWIMFSSMYVCKGVPYKV